MKEKKVFIRSAPGIAGINLADVVVVVKVVEGLRLWLLLLLLLLLEQGGRSLET
jgi:hypothetical protein